MAPMETSHSTNSRPTVGSHPRDRPLLVHSPVTQSNSRESRPEASTSTSTSTSTSNSNHPTAAHTRQRRHPAFSAAGHSRFVAHSPNEEGDDSQSPLALFSSAPASAASASASASDSTPQHTPTSRRLLSNQAARARALELQTGNLEIEGKEALSLSLQSGAPSRGKGQAQPDVTEEEEEESHISRAYLISYFVAGGAAGAASRTVVSPLERLKIIMQVQPRAPSSSNTASGAAAGKAAKPAYGGVVSGLVKMWQEEGFAGYMRGNGVNCLRIVPYSAIQFCSYEVAKDYLKHHQAGTEDAAHANGHHGPELDTPRRLAAGAWSGILACMGTYPLDLVRARISIASASLYADAKSEASSLSAGKYPSSSAAPSASSAAAAPAAPAPAPAPAPLSRSEMRALIAQRQRLVPGIWSMTLKVYREEGGLRGLYRGCIPTAAGVAPYVAINFAAYEGLRARFVEWSPDGEVSTLGKLACGALSGAFSQLATHPLDVLRRKMQVSGMRDRRGIEGSPAASSGGGKPPPAGAAGAAAAYPRRNASALEVIRTVVRQEGVRGMYRGVWPNLIKVTPSIGTSFLVYETVQQYIHPHPAHAHTHTHTQAHTKGDVEAKR